MSIGVRNTVLLHPFKSLTFFCFTVSIRHSGSCTTLALRGRLKQVSSARQLTISSLNVSRLRLPNLSRSKHLPFWIMFQFRQIKRWQSLSSLLLWRCLGLMKTIRAHSRTSPARWQWKKAWKHIGMMQKTEMILNRLVGTVWLNGCALWLQIRRSIWCCSGKCQQPYNRESEGWMHTNINTNKILTLVNCCIKQNQ